jgi:thiosulfate/3-mercaptopyruvate sulfurtransferase
VAALKPVVTTGWLGDMLHDEALRIADCRWYLTEPGRGHREYLSGHIPGAGYLSLDADLAAPPGAGRHPLPDAGWWRQHIGEIGIGSEHIVVAYDDRGGAIAARLWWMLRSLGHERVAVLDGGWTAWRAEQRSITTEVPVWPATVLEGAGAWAGTIEREELGDRLGTVTLIDARAAERFRGDEEPIDPVAGHIPTARSVPFTENLGNRDRFHAAHQLAARFSFAPPGTDIVVYCGSGVTACHDLLAMTIAGLQGGLLYPGSWSDWSVAGGPVETGPGDGRSPDTDLQARK